MCFHEISPEYVVVFWLKNSPNLLLMVLLTISQVVEVPPWYQGGDKAEQVTIQLNDAYKCMHH